MVTPAQGDICWAEVEDKRRPVSVVTRPEAIPVLTWIGVAPVTRTIRGIPTEIPLGPEHEVDVVCVASFDNLQPIRKTFLTRKIGSRPVPREEICRVRPRRLRNP